MLTLFALSVLAPLPSAARATTPVAIVEDVATLVRKGQTSLAEGRAEEARALFEQASKLDGDQLRTRVWLLRADVALGRIEETLATADELRKAGAKGPDLDYVYGIAFWALSKRQIAEGAADVFTEQQFADAAKRLDLATRADGDRYRDAFFPLAESAWYARDLDVARRAADRLIRNEPKSAQAHLLLGRVTLSQYVAAKDDPAQAAAAEEHWKAAVGAFERASSEFATRGDVEARAGRADAQMQLGNAHMWKSASEPAAKAYAAAIIADPLAVDFAQIHQALGGEAFLAAIEGAAASFQPPQGDETRESTLTWWLGWARFDQRDYAGAEKAFRAAVARTPGFVNSWYYVFRCEYADQRYAEAIETLRAYQKLDSASLAHSITSEQAFNMAALEYLIGWCANPDKHEGVALNLDAAMLCEICTLVAPEDARHWNNLGLFVRDHGDAIKREPTTSDEELQRLWDRAYAAYQRALELEPENPGFLNDTAVMLHYYLERDYERAKELYEKAARNAEAELARTDLDASRREWYQIALRDARNNLELLAKKMERKGGGS